MSYKITNVRTSKLKVISHLNGFCFVFYTKRLITNRICNYVVKSLVNFDSESYLLRVSLK